MRCTCGPIHQFDGRIASSLTHAEFCKVVECYAAAITQHQNLENLVKVYTEARKQYHGKRLYFLLYLQKGSVVDVCAAPYRILPEGSASFLDKVVSWKLQKDADRDILILFLCTKEDGNSEFYSTVCIVKK